MDFGELGDLGWLASTLASDAAGGEGVLLPEVRPLVLGRRLAGFASTVEIGSDDNRYMPEAIERGPAGGRVLVAGGGMESRRAALGGITGFQMVQNGFDGFVTDGLIRDREEVAKLALSVWCRGATPAASRKEGPGRLGGAVLCAGVLVNEGDFVVADDDGVVVWPRASVGFLLARARERLEADNRRLEQLRSTPGT
ncbi:MAG: RraA family protein [Candidatus Dormibacteraceae bacterium]